MCSCEKRAKGVECTKEDLEVMFFLARGCNAALDAPKMASPQLAKR